jgi:hypothetical protein
VESKLDNLIELYMQDRKRLLSLPICPEPHSNNLPQLPPNPPSGSASIIVSNTAVINNSGASCSSGLKVKMVNLKLFFKTFILCEF